MQLLTWYLLQTLAMVLWNCCYQENVSVCFSSCWVSPQAWRYWTSSCLLSSIETWDWSDCPWSCHWRLRCHVLSSSGWSHPLLRCQERESPSWALCVSPRLQDWGKVGSRAGQRNMRNLSGWDTRRTPWIVSGSSGGRSDWAGGTGHWRCPLTSRSSSREDDFRPVALSPADNRCCL